MDRTRVDLRPRSIQAALASAAALAVHLLATAAACAQDSVDLLRLNHPIAREPEYVGSPAYALLVFGERAETRVWAVLDSSSPESERPDILYFDRDCDGDLTDPDERIVELEFLRRGPLLHVGDWTEPGSDRVHRDVSFRARWREGKPEALISMQWSGEVAMHGGHGPSGNGGTRFAPSVPKAPILWFDPRGPRGFALEGSPRFRAGESTSIRILAGTLGAGQDTLCAYDVSRLDPERNRVQVKFDGRDDGGRELVSVQKLRIPATGDALSGRIEIPASASAGTARLVILDLEERALSRHISYVSIEITLWPAGVEEVALSGTIVLIDGDRRVTEPNGSMTIRAREPEEELDGFPGVSVLDPSNDLGTIPVAIVGGRFATTVPAGVVFDIRDVFLEGGLATVFPEASGLELPESGEIALEALRREHVTLHVVDRASGDPIEGITLLEQRGWRERNVAPNTQDFDRRIKSAAKSPVLVPQSENNPPFDLDPEREQTIWVGAPGRAWKQVTVDHDIGGEYRVELEPGGALVVELSGVSPPADAELRLSQPGLQGLLARMFTDLPADSIPVFEQRLSGFPEGEPIRIDGLPVGKYRVAIEVGEWFQGAIGLGRADAFVRAGEETRVELVVDVMPEPPAPGGLSGTLFVDPSWNERDIELEISADRETFFNEDVNRTIPIGSMQPDPEREGLWNWDAGPVPPGTYEIGIERFSLRKMVVVEEGAPARADLSIGPLCNVVVVLLDARSGEPIEGAEVTWGVVADEDSFTWPRSTAEPGRNPGQFRLQAPKGTIAIEVDSAFHLGHEEAVLEHLAQVVTLKLSPIAVVNLRCRESGRDRSWPFDLGSDLLLTFAGTQLQVPYSGMSRSSEGASYRLELAGRIQFAFPPIEGYEPIEPVEVEAAPGEVRDVVIELERKR